MLSAGAHVEEVLSLALAHYQSNFLESKEKLIFPVCFYKPKYFEESDKTLPSHVLFLTSMVSVLHCQMFPCCLKHFSSSFSADGILSTGDTKRGGKAQHRVIGA